MGTHPIFESDFDCLTDMETGSLDPALPEFPIEDPMISDLFCDDILNMPIDTDDHEAAASPKQVNLDDLADKFNPNEFFNQSTFISTKTGKEPEYASSIAGSMSSGTGSLSPSSQRGSPIHGGRITISIQPNEKTVRRLGRNSVGEKKQAKKARLDIKTELDIDDEDDEEEREMEYIETTTTDKDKLTVTGEERDVLEREGWELTEKNLKKARRKIKNKISAQESRKRKRDYVNNLEERLADYTTENQRLKTDLDKERTEKKSLVSQLRELQQVVGSRFQVKNTKTSGTQTSAAVMVVLLCCTVFKGSFFSSKEPTKDSAERSLMDTDFDYTTPSYKSRVLKCFTDDDMEFCVDDGVDVPVINFDSESDAEGDNDYGEYGEGVDDLLGEGIGRKMAALTLLENSARMRMHNNASEIDDEGDATTMGQQQQQLVIHTS